MEGVRKKCEGQSRPKKAQLLLVVDRSSLHDNKESFSVQIGYIGYSITDKEYSFGLQKNQKKNN